MTYFKHDSHTAHDRAIRPKRSASSDNCIEVVVFPAKEGALEITDYCHCQSWMHAHEEVPPS